MLRLILLFAAFILISCASGKAVTRDPEKVNEVMITFVQKAQAGFWKDAMENVTPTEAAEMMEEDGLVVMHEYREAINRIRFSNIRSMNLGLDSKKRLVGLKDALDHSNAAYRAPDAQIDLRRFEENAPRKENKSNSDEKPKEEDGFSSFIESFIKETVVEGEDEDSEEED